MNEVRTALKQLLAGQPVGPQFEVSALAPVELFVREPKLTMATVLGHRVRTVYEVKYQLRRYDAIRTHCNRIWWDWREVDVDAELGPDAVDDFCPTCIWSDHGIVYTFFDSAGCVLYVGMTFTPELRMQQHKYRTAWCGEVARIEGRCFAADEIHSAELEQIACLNPKYNRSPGPRQAA